MTAWHGHVQGIGIAGLAIEEFEVALTEAVDKYVHANHLVILATRGSSNEAARIASARMDSIQVSIRDIYEKCQETKSELNRYSGGM